MKLWSIFNTTQSRTNNLGEKKVGDIVNIETDLIGKYVERIFMLKMKRLKKKVK